MTLRADWRPIRDDPGMETFVQEIMSATMSSTLPKSIPACIGGRAGASLLTISYSGTVLMLVGKGSAGMLVSWSSCHEIEDASCTAEEKAMVFAPLAALLVPSLAVLVNVEAVSIS